MQDNIKVGHICPKGQSRKYWSVLKVKHDEKQTEEIGEINVYIQEAEAGENESTVALNGSLDWRSIVNWSEKTSLTSSQYVDETLAALTGNSNYVIELKKGKSTSELSWKKQLDDEEIFLKLGSLVLSHIKSTGDILKVCITTISKLQEELKDVTNEKNFLEKDFNQLLKKFEQCCEDKQKTEVELYTKFTLVINEKKRKIKELEELKDVKKHKNVTDSKPTQDTKKVSRNKEFFLESSDEESDQEIEPIKFKPRNDAKNLTKDALVFSDKPSTSRDTSSSNSKNNELYLSETVPVNTQELLDDF